MRRIRPFFKESSKSNWQIFFRYMLQQKRLLLFILDWINNIEFFDKSFGEQWFNETIGTLKDGNDVNDIDGRQHLRIMILTFAGILGIAINAFAIVLTEGKGTQIDESNALGETTRATSGGIQYLKHPFHEIPKWPFIILNLRHFILINAFQFEKHDNPSILIGMTKNQCIIVIAGPPFADTFHLAIQSRWVIANVRLIQLFLFAIQNKLFSRRRCLIDFLMTENVTHNPKGIVFDGIVQRILFEIRTNFLNLFLVLFNQITHGGTIIEIIDQWKGFFHVTVFIHPGAR
mmetsp:Transcript_20890/g.34528  ORF Transcript_20890/g.34528 Transcript_20890/m.34528 type:complete len:289 (+) Transcript_20890:161-1027(+)